MKITFAEDGWSEYLYWQTQDKKIVKKINQLLQSIERDGALQGIGKPEPLKYGKSGSFSRRIDEANREDCSKFGTHKTQSLRRIPTRPSKLWTSAFSHNERTSYYASI